MAVGESSLPAFYAIEGAQIGVAKAGIKTPGRKDLVVFRFEAGSRCAGVFTKNAFCAAPVQICKSLLNTGLDTKQPFYFVINTGNANAGTGEQGMQDAVTTCEGLAAQVGSDKSQVLPFSTGVIGEKLPVEKIIAGIPAAITALDSASWSEAAEGIMTTDTRPKGATREIKFGGSTVKVSGVSKGAGMIKPNMATMLGFVATDANISQPLLEQLLKEAADASFNRITIDGDTSTNDACMLVATGQSAAPEITETHDDFESFKAALKGLFIELAHLIVRDGEGATKFVSVAVEGALTQEEALESAYTIAHSPLIKTALFASDPNWGRILAALGRAPIENFDLNKVDIYLGDVQIVSRGGKCSDYTEEKGQAVMNQEEIDIRILLQRGDVNETVWTTDLSHDYVTINAEYRT